MISYIALYPLACKPEDMLLTQQTTQMKNWFVSDVQVRGKYPHFAERFFKENNIVLKMEPKDEEILRAGTGEMAKRYGFIYVNKYDDGTGTLKRMKKKSFEWYKKVIRTNGEELG